jgi:threonine dehydrogenase-like Zn-dependent dehydrogenase
VASLIDVPPPEGDGVLIRVASVGICGSDLHLLSWNLPSTLGHEMAGFLPDGTAVAVEPMAPCGSCPECQSGAYNLCRLGPSMLIGTGRDGGMADECLVPPSAIVPLAGGVPVGDACLVEPLAVPVTGSPWWEAGASGCCRWRRPRRSGQRSISRRGTTISGRWRTSWVRAR